MDDVVPRGRESVDEGDERKRKGSSVKRRSSSVDTGRWSGMSDIGYTHEPPSIHTPIFLDTHTQLEPFRPNRIGVSSPITSVIKTLTPNPLHSPTHIAISSTSSVDTSHSTTTSSADPPLEASVIVPHSQFHDNVSSLTTLRNDEPLIRPDDSPTEPTFRHTSIQHSDSDTIPRSTTDSIPFSDSSPPSTPSVGTSTPSSLTKGPDFGSFPTPPVREAGSEPNTSPRPSLLPPLPIALLSLSLPVTPTRPIRAEPMSTSQSLDDHGHWVSSSRSGMSPFPLISLG